MDGKKVVVEFTEQGLQDILDRLYKVGAVDAKQAADFKASNLAFAERLAAVEAIAASQAKVTTETTKTTKSMGDLASAAQKATQNIVNGTTNEAIKQTGALLDKATDSYKAQSAAIAEQKAQIKDLTNYIDILQRKKSDATPGKVQSDYNKKINEATFELQGLLATLKNLEATQTKTGDAGKKNISIFTELRKQYNDLSRAAEEAYASGNKAFGDELQKKAGEVKNRIQDIRSATQAYASDTRIFDAIGAGVRGIGAGFQIAQGTQALFGQGSKDLQEQLVKIQGTMALVNGLTEIQNLLQKESALRIGLNNAAIFIRNSLERVGITLKTTENGVDEAGNAIKSQTIVVQAIENGLQAESVIVRGAATAAQWLLNTAVLAFPLIALIAGLTALVYLLGGFGDSLEKSAESQIKLNEYQKENLKILQAQDDLINKLSSDYTDQIQREIDLLVARKASTEEIRIKEKQLQDERNRNAQFQKGNHAIEIHDLQENRLAVVGLTSALEAYNKAKTDSGDDKFDKTIEAVKGKLEIVQELVKQGEDAERKALDESIKARAQAIEQEQQRELEGLAFQKTIIDAKLRFAKVGSDQQLALQLAAAKNERDTAIANLKASNESTADIEAAYLQKQRDLNIEYNNHKLRDQIALNNATLISVQKGSGSELDLKLSNLQAQHELELNDLSKTNAEKLASTKAYLNTVNVLLSDFARKQTENELNAEILRNEAKLTLTDKSSEEEFIRKQKFLVLQEQLNILAIDKNIEGTELGEAKKLEITARYAKLTRQLNIDAAEVILKDRERTNNEQASFLQKQADLEANNVNTQLQRKQQLALEAFDNTQALADKQFDIDSQRYLNGEIAEKDYYQILAKYQDEYLLNKQAKANLDAQQQRENLIRNVDLVTQYATDGLNALSALADAQSAIAQAAYDKDNKANEEAHKNKRESDAQYEVNRIAIEKRLALAKKKAAQQDKDISLFQIGINTAQAAIKAIATAPNYVVGAVEAALALAFGAIQYAAAASKPIPEFYKGTENAPEGWAWVGEKGPELVWMKGGSKVKTHEESIKMVNTPSLRNSYAEKIDRAPVPSEAAEKAMQHMATNHPGIDINALSKLIGDEVGNHLAKMPLTQFNFDKNGFQASVKDGNSHTTFLNSRYSTGK